MDETDVRQEVAAPAGSSRRTAGQTREERIERLKKYRWTKGQSGNSSGRPKNLPVTEKFEEGLRAPLPTVVREMLEKVLKERLPDDMTIGDGWALAKYLAMFGFAVGFRLEISEKMRVAVQGLDTQRVVVEAPAPETSEDRKKQLFARIAEIGYAKSTMYNMDIPSLREMAKDAGVELPGLPPAPKDERKGVEHAGGKDLDLPEPKEGSSR